MPYIMNTLDDEIKTQAHGKWFTFKPQEIKTIHNEHLARFFAQHRGEEGLVEVPETVMEMDKSSTQYKEAIYQLRRSGIQKYVAQQNFIIRNLEMSLRKDYETSGQKGNFLFEASKGELEAYKNLKKYKEFEAREQLNVADQIQKLRDELYGNNESRPSPTESAAPATPLNRK